MNRNQSFQSGFSDFRQGSTFAQDPPHKRDVLHSPIVSSSQNFQQNNPYYPSSNSNFYKQSPYQNMNNNAHFPSQHYASAASNLNDAPVTPTQYIEKAPRKRKVCLCFTKKGCYIFLFCLLILAGALAVTGYFLWPRIPNAEFESVSVATSSDQSGNSSNVQDILQATKVQSSGAVTVPLALKIRLDNPNYIRWTFSNITVTGNIQLDSQTTFDVGNGTIYQHFSMPKRSVNNDVIIYFNFVLDSKSQNFLRAASVVQTSCTTGGPPLRFNYKAKIFIDAIKWLGIKPTISNTVSINCPTADLAKLGVQISDLLATLTGKQS
ncbi:hypothetical protein BB560_000929 [Smittium megazygosporum]|uniref:Uncharacterized protein n=1 Tax=Smittium megazygosporum TaxID=133381 RepID=A0A2T9ZJ37_9FUNG|nr:hypothetical protein BB560_000929 [Smittium megazygosporum]